jgi:hypothetical protein
MNWYSATLLIEMWGEDKYISRCLNTPIYSIDAVDADVIESFNGSSVFEELVTLFNEPSYLNEVAMPSDRLTNVNEAMTSFHESPVIFDHLYVLY